MSNEIAAIKSEIANIVASLKRINFILVELEKPATAIVPRPVAPQVISVSAPTPATATPATATPAPLPPEEKNEILFAETDLVRDLLGEKKEKK